MLYWSEFAGATVYADKKRMGHIENMMLDPNNKMIYGFLLERRNRDLRYRYFPFTQIQIIERDHVQIKDVALVKLLNRPIRKKAILTEDFIQHSIMDEKGEWVGRVVDFAFNPTNGLIREVIVSSSLLEDLWNGRKIMPVLSQVEFSRELIHIDQDTREEISGLKKGLKNWLDI